VRRGWGFVTSQDQIDTSYGISVVLDNDVEEEIGIGSQDNKNKPYVALDLISDPNFAISAVLEAKIRMIYS